MFFRCVQMASIQYSIRMHNIFRVQNEYVGHFGLFKHDKISFLAYPHRRHFVFFLGSLYFWYSLIDFPSHTSQRHWTTIFDPFIIFLFFVVSSDSSVMENEHNTLFRRFCLFYSLNHNLHVERRTEKPMVVLQNGK